MPDLAEQYDIFRKEFESLAGGLLRFAEHADRSPHMGLWGRTISRGSARMPSAEKAIVYRQALSQALSNVRLER